MKVNKKIATLDEMIAKLNKKFPKLQTKTTDKFYINKQYLIGIWCSGEKDILGSDGFVLIDYYATNNKVKRYEFGVHIQLRNLLEKNGWYAEWYDCGTIMFYPIQ